MLNAIRLIFLKEITEVLRDKRSLIVVLFITIIMPLSLLGGLHFAAHQEGKAEAIEYGIIGTENDPALISFLNSKGFLTTDASEDSKIQLTIPEDYRPLINKGFVPTLSISADFSQNPQAISMLQGALKEYGSNLAAGRLVARGISPIIMQPFRIDTIDTGEVSIITRYLAPGFIFMFLMIPIYVLMPASIDCTAGERERHGLFPMLSLPIPALSIPIGKFLMLVASGMSGLAVALIVGFIGYENFSPPGVPFSFDLSLTNGLLFFLTAFPTVMALAGLMMGFASFAKTFKEGQSYVGMGTLVPMLFIGLGFLLDESWRPYLPFWSETTVLSAILSGDLVTLLPWLGLVTGYILFISLCLWWVSRTMQRQALEG